MSIETEHRGLKIRYSENADQWECWDLKLEAASLSKLKDKIDRALSAVNKRQGVPALKFDGDSYGPAKATPCLIMGNVILEKERDYKAPGFEKKYVEVPYVFIAWEEGGKKKREKVKLETLLRPAPEIEGELAKMEALRLEGKAIDKRRAEVAAALPRMRPEDVPAVKLEVE